MSCTPHYQSTLLFFRGGNNKVPFGLTAQAYPVSTYPATSTLFRTASTNTLRLLLLSCCFLVAGCTVTPEMWEAAAAKCENNGGIEWIKPDGARFKCKNGLVGRL